MRIWTEWKAKRTMKTTIKLIERMLDEMPLSFFRQLAPGVDPIETMNTLSRNVSIMKATL